MDGKNWSKLEPAYRGRQALGCVQPPLIPNVLHRAAQLTPVLGVDPNTDPGLAGETGLSRD
jgi:hypothetical protein